MKPSSHERARVLVALREAFSSARHMGLADMPGARAILEELYVSLFTSGARGRKMVPHHQERAMTPNNDVRDAMIQENRAVAQAAGYAVGEDPDQPGRYVWTRTLEGQWVGGCDSSLDSEAEAWGEAAFEAASEVMGDLDLSTEQWESMGVEQKLDRVREVMA